MERGRHQEGLADVVSLAFVPLHSHRLSPFQSFQTENGWPKVSKLRMDGLGSQTICDAALQRPLPSSVLLS